MVKRILGSVIRVSLFLGLLTYAVVQLPVVHTKFLVTQSYKSIFIITPTNNSRSGGTGFQIETPEGPRIITNAHVCRVLELGVGKIHAYDNFSFRAAVIRQSRTADLCMLEGNPAYPSLKMGSKLANFDRIQVIGHPLLQPLTPAPGYILTRQFVGVNLGLLPQSECHDLGGQLAGGLFLPVCIKNYDAQLTNAVIYPGSSGSPVLNFWGNVSGVIFAGNVRTHYGIMVPFEHLRAFILNRPTKARHPDQNRRQSQIRHHIPPSLPNR